jgi:thiol-disulfide isomerase/thioredoxin
MLSKFITLAKLLVLAVCFVIAIFVVACTTQKLANSDATPVLSRPPNTAYPMPPLKAYSEMGWTLGDGRQIKFADQHGKVLVLDFYATWCAPCRESIPRLILLEQRYGPQGLQVVGLNVGGPDDRIKVADFAKELRIQYSLGFPDKALTDLFLSDDQTIPQTFLFGREGQLVKRFIGYESSTETELEALIQSEIAKPPNK